MVTRQDALKEMARRELARRQQQPQMSTPGRQSEPTIIEEMHPEVSATDRAIVKNFGNDPEQAARFLQERNPNLEVRNYGDKMLIRGKGEKEYRVLDPDTGFFSTDFLHDASDVAYDVGSGVVEGAGAVAAGVGTMNPLAAVGANAGLGAANETLRQYLGKKLGVNKEIDTGEVALVGAISGALPVVGDLAKAGYKAGAGTIKGATKFLTGVTEENIEQLKKKPGIIEKAEAEGVAGRLQAKADAISGLTSDAMKRQSDEIERIRSTYNVANDEDVIKVLDAEKNAIYSKAQTEGRALKPNEMQRLGELGDTIASLGDTQQVRSAIPRVGTDEDALRSDVFPEALSLDDAIQNLPVHVKGGLEVAFDEVSQKYAKMAGQQHMIPTEVIKQEFEDAIGRAGMGLGTEQQKAFADLLTREYNTKFKIPNELKDFTVKSQGGSYQTPYVVGKDITTDGKPIVTDPMAQFSEGGLPVPRDPNMGAPKGTARVTTTMMAENNNKAHTVKGKQQVISLDEAMGIKSGRPITNDPFIDLPDEVTLEAFQGLKGLAASGAGYDQALNNKIGKAAADGLQNFYRGLERKMQEQLNISTRGDNAIAASQYKKLIDAQKQMKQMFNTDNAAKTTINQALKGNATVLRKLREFDELAGTNMTDQIEATIRANEITKKGLQQNKLFTESSELATKQAKENLGEDMTLLEKLNKRMGTSKDLQGSLASVRAGGDPELYDMITKVQSKYGPKAGEAVDELVKEMDAINYFADPKNFNLFGMGGKETADGALQQAATGLGGALGWQLGVGAAGAQGLGRVGQYFGQSAKVRQTVRKNLERAFKLNETLKGMDEETQKWLKKQVMGRVTQGDVLREASKTAVDVQSERP